MTSSAAMSIHTVTLNFNEAIFSFFIIVCCFYLSLALSVSVDLTSVISRCFDWLIIDDIYYALYYAVIF